MRRQRNNSLLFVIISICSVLALVIFINYLFSPSYKSKKVVAAFYTHEQKGDFARSWELLHPYMKGRWDKAQFMSDRYHVFVGHFGTDKFQYTIKKDNKMKDWKMTEESQTLDIVYKYTVTQTYKGKYGRFSFVQEVYVAKDEEEWRILWDYN